MGPTGCQTAVRSGTVAALRCGTRTKILRVPTWRKAVPRQPWIKGPSSVIAQTGSFVYLGLQYFYQLGLLSEDFWDLQAPICVLCLPSSVVFSVYYGFCMRGASRIRIELEKLPFTGQSMPTGNGVLSGICRA